MYKDYGPDLERSTFSKSATLDDGDVDLFGSDDEEDAEAERIREQRLADYKARKASKPKTIAKSVVILDVKPWGMSFTVLCTLVKLTQAR